MCASIQHDAEMRDILLEHLPGIAMILRKTTREIVFSNEVARQAGAVPGKTCYGTISGRETPCPFCVAPGLWETGKPAMREVQYEGKHYEGRWLPLTDELYVHYIFDITERMRVKEENELLQAQLLQAQKLEAIGQLAGGVAHDFRNQLTVIKGFGEMLLRRDMVKPDGVDKLKEMLKAAEKSTRLTDQLLAFSRTQDLEAKLVDVSSLMVDIDTAIGRMVGEDTHLTVRIGCETCMVETDPGQFRRAIINLVANARDAMPTGGKLTIDVSCGEVTAPVRRRHGDAGTGSYVRVAVSDTGCGMDDSTIAKLFEPFFTAKAVGKGTGMGLAMVYGFVKQSGGFVDVQSRPGEGSTFALYLPQA